MIELASQDKIEAALAKEFPGIERDRKEVLLQHVHHAFSRHTEAELHKIFSETLPDAERAFYNEIVVERPDEGPAGAGAAIEPPAPAPTPEAAANAHSEGSRAAEAESTR